MKRAIAIALLLVASVATADYVPPVGIPAPPFGINEVAPTPPDPWNTPTAGWYYICEDCPGSTDSGRTYGTPSAPRKTIPLSLPAGAYVELHGVYTASHNPNVITLNGVSDNIIWIRGVDMGANLPTATKKWTVQGSYAVIENIHFDKSGGANVGGQTIATNADASYVAWRNIRATGNDNNLVGFTVGQLTDNTKSHSYIVFDNLDVRNNGSATLESDSQDYNGVHVGVNANHIWVLRSAFTVGSGAAVQVRAGSAARTPDVHHVYVGSNTVDNTSQAGLFSKEATEVIFSSNIVRNVVEKPWSPSKCYGWQYAPDNVWFINNIASGCSYGIRSGSDSGGVGKNIYIVGNLFYDTHAHGVYNDATYPPAAISLLGGDRPAIVGNTFWGYPRGIHIGPTVESLSIANNIMGGRTSPADYDVYVGIQASADVAVVENNLYDNAARIWWAGTPYDNNLTAFTSAEGKGAGQFVASPGFVDAGANNYALTASSPAIDNGTVPSAFDTFQDLYGVSIATDIAGTTRPRDATFDIGAYEYGGEIPADNTAPSKPGNMTATALGPTSIRVTWDASTDAVGVVGYFLYRGGAHYQTVYGLTYTDSGLTPETEYTYAVEAFDAAGNESADSDPASATTTPYPVLLRGTVRGRMQ